MSKFQPSLSEIVGHSKARGTKLSPLDRLKECILNKTNVIVYGEAGIGKTSSVYALAKSLGYDIVEINASDERRTEDLEEISRLVRMLTFNKCIYLFDEVDGLKNGRLMGKILDKSIHPIVMTANEIWKVSEAIKRRSDKIRFYPPRIDEVLKRVKEIADKKGIRPRYDMVTRDVRSSINAALYGSKGREVTTIFDKITNLFINGRFDKSLKNEKNVLIWLMDNAPKFYFGEALLEFYETLSKVDTSGRLEILDCIRRGKHEKVNYPFYLRRLKVMGKKKEGEINNG